MPRPARFAFAGQPQHIVQRGNNRQPIFFTESDYRVYVSCLIEAKRKYGCQVHAYVLMTNHVHLLASAAEVAHVSRMMQHLGARYVRYINSKHHRTGTLWEGRFKASLIDSELYFLQCCRYIENNPLRAGIVGDPADYAWSSHRFHAFGNDDQLLTAHELYRRLGNTPDERQRHYRELFLNELGAQTLREIREAINRGWPLGGEQFKDRVERALLRHARPPKRGRPKRGNAEAAQEMLL